MSATAGKVALVDGTAPAGLRRAPRRCAARATPPRRRRHDHRPRRLRPAADRPRDRAPRPRSTNQSAAMRTNRLPRHRQQRADFTTAPRRVPQRVRRSRRADRDADAHRNADRHPRRPANGDAGAVRIHDIQGAAHRSPLEGTPVSNVFGIVTFKHQAGSGRVRLLHPGHPRPVRRRRPRPPKASWSSPAPIRSAGSMSATRCGQRPVSEFRSGGAELGQPHHHRDQRLGRRHHRWSRAAIRCRRPRHRRRRPPAADRGDRRRPRRQRSRPAPLSIPPPTASTSTRASKACGCGSTTPVAVSRRTRFPEQRHPGAGRPGRQWRLRDRPLGARRGDPALPATFRAHVALRQRHRRSRRRRLQPRAGGAAGAVADSTSVAQLTARPRPAERRHQRRRPLPGRRWRACSTTTSATSNCSSPPCRPRVDGGLTRRSPRSAATDRLDGRVVQRREPRPGRPARQVRRTGRA